MTAHITKTWFDGEKVVTQEIPESEVYKQEPVALETVYETIIHWDEGGGKRSRRELARRIVALYTTPPAAQRQPQYNKTEMNCFVQNLYDQKMREGKRGHYETMFHVVHRAIEAAHGITGDKPDAA
jgi:hypothetical protein